MQRQGKLPLNEERKPVSSTCKRYLGSLHSLWYWTTLAFAITAAILVFIVPDNTGPIAYARSLLGFIFVLLLPGYTFVQLLFRAKELDKIEGVALGIIMSLAFVSIVGLFLNYTPWGLRRAPITLSLLILVVLFSTTSIIQDYRRTKTRPASNLQNEL